MQLKFIAQSAICFGLAVSAPLALAQTSPEVTPSTDLIQEDVIEHAREMLANPVVIAAIRARNAETQTISQSEIDALDLQWREERDSSGAQPTITAALGSPASTFLLRQQAASKGLYSEIFIMDMKGLNVGQSSITSDYWQGDEAKFQETVPNGLNAIFIDEAEYNSDLGIWLAQLNLTLDDDGEVIGSGTIEINLTELQRRTDLGL